MVLTDEEKWTAFSNNDEQYNGLFVTAVKTTGIYCRPSCKARLPLRKNIRFYSDSAKAEADGFRPCKLCRPDLFDYRPLKETAQQMKTIIEHSFIDRKKMWTDLNGIGYSVNHLSAIFSQHYHMTINDCRNQLRIAHVLTQLEQTELSVSDIAYSSGFDSLAAFYRLFKSATGSTPTAFRKQRRQVKSI